MAGLGLLLRTVGGSSNDPSSGRDNGPGKSPAASRGNSSNVAADNSLAESAASLANKEGPSPKGIGSAILDSLTAYCHRVHTGHEYRKEKEQKPDETPGLLKKLLAEQQQTNELLRGYGVKNNPQPDAKDQSPASTHKPDEDEDSSDLKTRDVDSDEMPKKEEEPKEEEVKKEAAEAS